MITIRHFIQAALVAISLLLSACCSTGTTTHYLLRPDESLRKSAEDMITSKPHLRLFIADVTLPSFLRRKELVTLADDSQIKTHPRFHWAEPLEQNVRSVLQQNFEYILGTNEVLLMRQSDCTPMTILFRHFEPTEHHTLLVDAVAVAKFQRSIQQHIEFQLNIDDYPSTVAAHNAALARIADELAKWLQDNAQQTR